MAVQTEKKLDLLIELLAIELNSSVQIITDILEDYDLIEVVKEVTELPGDVMIKLSDFKDTGKHFRCECGGNVFRKRSDGKYVCNSCRETYSSNKEDSNEQS